MSCWWGSGETGVLDGVVMLRERYRLGDRRRGCFSRRGHVGKCRADDWCWRTPTRRRWLTGFLVSGALLGPISTYTQCEEGATAARQGTRTGLSIPQTQQRRGRNSESLYHERCASCHGENLDKAGRSLVDNVWKYGSADRDIEASIRERHRDRAGARLDDLSPGEVRALVIWIRERRAGADVVPRVSGAVPRVVELASSSQAFAIQTVIEGVEDPWGLAFLPDGGMLITEHGGRLRRVSRQGGLETIAGTPAVWARGQGGLLDVAVDPRYSENGWIYLTYSDPGPVQSAMTAVVRGRIEAGRWIDEQVLFRAAPELYQISMVHFGSRLAFDTIGNLYFTIGERGHSADAQDLSRPDGIVHRIRVDGTVPSDNPFVGRAGTIDTIWTYGNRNPQGLAVHPLTGELWETEHGPRGGDELNVLASGRNYGWPVVTHGMNHDGTPMSETTEREGMESPVYQWTPSITVSSLAFYTGRDFERWRNNLLVGSLVSQDMRRIVVEGHRVVEEEVLFRGLGKVRSIVLSPDGGLYVVFNDPDRIAKVSLARENPVETSPR